MPFAEDFLPQKKQASNLRTEKLESGEDWEKEHGMIAAGVTTTLALLLFVVPSLTLIWTSLEPAVGYWSTTWLQVLFAIPVVIVGVHLYQVKFGANQNAVGVALVLPSILLMFMLVDKELLVGMKVQELFSISCDAFPEKTALQLEWEAARDFYDQCITDTAASNKGITREVLIDHFSVRDCTQYEEAYANHAAAWGYLSMLEEKYGCSGWCIPGQQLWSHGPHKDSCSDAVGAAFQYFSCPRVYQALWLVFCILLLAGTFFPFCSPYLASKGL